MKSIKFTVPGNPFGKQRPKFARMGTYTKTYTPKKTTQHEKEVAECFLEVARGRRFKEKEPLDIRIIAYYPIPQSTSKKRRKEMLEHRIRPTVKPDLDNVAKLIYDALNGVAWYDDNAIVDTQVRKFYSDTPRVDVFIRAVEGYADVVERGTNTDVYVFRVDNTKSISQSISTASLVTRVKVLGQADDDGNSPVEATVDGLTKYGIRQRIYTRGKDESLDEAKTAAQKIIDEDGVIDEEITVQAPDVPFIRKGDLVYVMIGSAQNYYYVVGIRHDCDNYSMTMDLELAKTETATQTTKKKDYNVGDIVNFKGGTHYVSSYSGSRGYSARAGKAKITIKNGSGKTHPWHLIHTDSGSNVYGWVDDGTFE